MINKTVAFHTFCGKVVLKTLTSRTTMTLNVLNTIIFFLILNSFISPGSSECISVTQCTAAVKYLQDFQNKDIHDSSLEILKKAYCGNSRQTARVACEQVPTCYEPTDRNFCVRAKDCCPALRLIKWDRSEIPNVKNTLKQYVCSGGGSDVKVKCSSLREVEERLLNQATDSDVCITPNGLKGRCISKEICPTFFGKPLTSNHKEYFAKSVCDKKKEKVCCAPNDNVDHICGVDNKDVHKISGGNITAENEFPWVVILKYDNPDLVCGGTLLNSQFVLTAAHCIREDLRKIQIAGNFKRGEINPEFRVLSIKASPYYQRRPLRNDIALIRIEKVTYQDNIKWICLPSSANEPLPRDYTVVGNGETENHTLSTHQLKAIVPNLPTAECQRRYENHFNNYEDFIICAGGKVGVDACRGDSGGPLMSRGGHPFWSLYGVVSGGSPDCTDGSPGFYTRVDKFIDWVQSTMKNMLINK